MSLSSRAILVLMCFMFLSCPLFTTATTTTTTDQGPQPRCEAHIFNNGKHYRSCKDLPVLDSFLHFSYARETGVLDVAYRHANLESSSWIAWAINPTKKGMLGAQCLVAYRNSTSGVMRAYTSSINSYATMLQESPLSFGVSQVSAEYVDGEMTIFATLVLPPNTTVVNHLWQDGPLKGGDRLGMHAMSGDHLKSMSTLDLLSGQVTATKSVNGNMLLVKQIHGLVNTVSWGILMPIGVMVARYMKIYETLDPTWFYVHVICQLTGYVAGLLGGLGTAIYMAYHTGMRSTAHTIIGILIFCLGLLQILALKARPGKDHKYRTYWNWYHHTVGYVVVVLSVYNIYKGFVILQPGSGWKIAYTAIICAIGAFAIVMEMLQFKKRWGGLFEKKPEDQEANQSGFANEISNFEKRWSDKIPEDLEANQIASTGVV
ncbi:Cytochrome b561 and DOMON domain-containing protein [Raphanus sativus]|uniref:Cytochrome b561 and DOMON domain-containing protein n=1 Tax=Raphanus sativus TaxID=3726 RepID=A0A6J0NUB5_RAPSA|nr:cytochrome b561 and DOMON domain-containing protein At5g48750-like [Raphanus sativus]KAJ4896178.1 Cytochrome b561 and DOMON domain-containing protein [Raphanus sativus]